MIVEKVSPRIVTYKLIAENGDAVSVVIDYDACRLSIYGMEGDYTYCWDYCEVVEDFPKLLSEASMEYLLERLSCRSQFLLEDSKEKTIECIEYNGFNLFGIKTKRQWEKIKRKIYDINDCCCEKAFCREIGRLIPSIDDESIITVRNYPMGAFWSVKLFMKHVQPVLKEECSKDGK